MDNMTSIIHSCILNCEFLFNAKLGIKLEEHHAWDQKEDHVELVEPISKFVLSSDGYT